MVDDRSVTGVAGSAFVLIFTPPWRSMDLITLARGMSWTSRVTCPQPATHFQTKDNSQEGGDTGQAKCAGVEHGH